MSTSLLSSQMTPSVRVAATALAVAAILGFTSCSKLRPPEELLNGSPSQMHPQDMARAAELFGRNCAICHGETGEGDGQYFATGLEPTPSDLTRETPDSLNLADLGKWIRTGSSAFGRSPLCPAWQHTIPDKNIDDLAQFVLTLREEPQPSLEESQPGDEDPDQG